MTTKLYILILLIACASIGRAQSVTKLMREGNKLYQSKLYAKAEVAYRKALQKDGRRADAVYNLGRTLQAEKKNKEAIEQYKQSASLENNAQKRASSYYNSGTIYQQQKDYKKAIAAYKDALRNNPNHSKARYNLELCKQEQKKQQNRGNGGDNNQKDKNKQQQDKNKQNKQKQNNNQQNKDKKQQDNDMSKDNAQRLLDAAMQQEKATQDRLSKAMHQPSNKQLEKNW